MIICLVCRKEIPGLDIDFGGGTHHSEGEMGFTCSLVCHNEYSVGGGCSEPRAELYHQAVQKIQAEEERRVKSYFPPPSSAQTVLSKLKELFK